MSKTARVFIGSTFSAIFLTSMLSVPAEARLADGSGSGSNMPPLGCAYVRAGANCR